VGLLKNLFGEGAVLPLGPNRKAKQRPQPAVEAPLIAPSDELVEV